MSNGDSLDGFVFPPFIPAASRQPQAPPPQPAAQQPTPAVEASGRMTMPWDLETPIVRQADEAPAAQPTTAADEDDLPWLEVPTPRDADAEASPPPAAGEEAFPEWMAWDQRDETAAEADARDSVAPIAGLEDFIPANDLNAGFVAPAPAVEWAEADPAYDAVTPADHAPQADSFDALFDAPTDFAAPAASDAPPAFDAPADFDAPPAFDAPANFDAPPAFDAPADFDAPPAFDAPAADAEPFTEGSFEAPAAESAAPAWDAPAAEPEPAADAWSLATPEAAEPPAADAGATWEESPAAAAPSYEVSVDASDDALTFEPAAAEAPAAEDALPMAQPFVADEEAVIASEPDPFTAASVAEAEAVAPAEPAHGGSAFDDVAARLESIARMLRERPDELLAGGSSDPLALLVTGYVMGYTARGR